MLDFGTEFFVFDKGDLIPKDKGIMRLGCLYDGLDTLCVDAIPLWGAKAHAPDIPRVICP